MPPDRMFLDSQHFCTFLNHVVHENACELFHLGQFNATEEKINFIIPRGNTVSMGTFEVNTKFELTNLKKLLKKKLLETLNIKHN